MLTKYARLVLSPLVRHVINLQKPMFFGPLGSAPSIRHKTEPSKEMASEGELVKLHDREEFEVAMNRAPRLDPMMQIRFGSHEKQEIQPDDNDTAELKSFLDDIRPPLKRSFNLGAYVNSSETLQALVKLGVSLFDIENTNMKAARSLVMLDFAKECVPYIKFLVQHGLKDKNLGRFISEYPGIFQVPLGDLEIRIKYLKSKGFTDVHISRALNRSSLIISSNVKTLDYKLGEFQIEFDLPAPILRHIVAKYPPSVALPSGQYKMVNFTLREEFGFETREIHVILKEQPTILDILRPVLIDRLELVHNTIGLDHATICKFPKLITGPVIDIRHRFMYLSKLKRNQFNPQKPLYVPPSALYNGSDENFCQLYAKTSIEDYKFFIKFN